MKGHLLSECWALEKKEKKKPNVLVTTTDHSAGELLPKTPDTFKQFISQGCISIDNKLIF